MTEDYIAKYKEEESESSIVSEEDEFKEILAASKDKPAATTSSNSENSQRKNQFTPYTFDPKMVLKDLQPSTGVNPVMPNQYTPTSLSDNKFTTGNFNMKGYGTYVQAGYMQNKPKEMFPQQIPDMSFLTTLGENITECRKTDDYKGFAQEFEKQFGNDQREMEQVTKDLNSRTGKLDNFIKELQGADLDMILYRNRLVREIQDVQNDLREAYNNILVLMNDRSTMRDQFCIFKMKIKKLKGFVKTYLDDIQAY